MRCWKREVERGSLPGRALGPDSAAVAVDDGLGDVETKSDASSVIRVHLKKPPEHRFQFVGGDSHAGVTDRDANLFSGLFDVNDDSPAGWRELERIAQQIAKYLKNPRCIERGG